LILKNPHEALLIFITHTKKFTLKMLFQKSH